MKTHKGWSYRPYSAPFINPGAVYVNRIVPYENSVHFEWNAVDGKCEVFFRILGEERWIKAGETTENYYDVSGLATETDYEFYVSCGDKKSRIRLFRTGRSVGVVVNYLHPMDKAYAFSGSYLCSPSIVRAPQGHLLASMDVFGHLTPQNLTLIFRSDDEGESWHYQCELFPCFWGKMFVHDGELYMLSVSTEYGDLQIGKSTDGGKSWSDPVILFRGGGGKKSTAGMHKAPVPVIEFKGRLWTAVEWGGAWEGWFYSAMAASVPVDADLMNPESWSFTQPIRYNPEWAGVPRGFSIGSFEGSIVERNGELYNFMRYDMSKLERRYGLALRFKLDSDDPEKPLSFDRVVNFNANASKFSVQKDAKTGDYYTIANYITDDVIFNDGTAFGRNHLCLMKSKNLDDWSVVCSLLDYRHADPQKVGFQYVDWFIEGDDILYLCRTAINNADDFHDSNYSTFHRIKNFREL